MEKEIEYLIEKYDNKLDKASDYINLPGLLLNTILEDLRKLQKIDKDKD